MLPLAVYEAILQGGHGDHILEIMCSQWITKNGAPLERGDVVEIEFFGD